MVKTRRKMKTNYRTELGYQVPSIFRNRDVALAFLKSAGIKNPNKSIGKLYYLLNHLRVNSQVNGRRYGNWKGWVPISREIIRKLFGNMTFFYPIIKKLEADKLIQIDNSYEIGKQCKQYRLTPAIDKEEWKLVKVKSADCSTTRKVIEYSMKKWRPIDHKLYNRLTQFNIDEIAFFEQTTEHNFQDFPCEMLDTLVEGCTSNETPLHRYRFYQRCYNDIMGGEWRYNEPDRFGRRHNNLTNLPKVLRQHLYVFKNGIKRRLTSIDISNSQVLLLLTILPDTLQGYDIFKESVEEGCFYELLAVLCCRSRPNGKYKDCTSEDKVSKELRKAVKKEYFYYVYGDNNEVTLTSGNVFQAMYENFNSINGYICFLKNRKSYQYPSRQMQRAESSIIIDHVCYGAVKQELMVAQIYDSILCLEEDVEVIKQLMTEGFKNKNLKVTLKVE